MIVKVIWRNRNPFVPRLEDMCRGSEAELPDNMGINIIEYFAKDATPEGYYLDSIILPSKTIVYNARGEVTEEK